MSSRRKAVIRGTPASDEPGFFLRDNSGVVLAAIRLAHTVIWAFFAGCIVALPVAAWAGRFDWAAGLTLVVLVECAVLLLNHGRCPLTDLAARYTQERGDNFDIYLPQFVARHNKVIFGTLYVGGVLVLVWRWLR
jgi:hypothetical protein